MTPPPTTINFSSTSTQPRETKLDIQNSKVGLPPNLSIKGSIMVSIKGNIMVSIKMSIMGIIMVSIMMSIKVSITVSIMLSNNMSIMVSGEYCGE